MKREITVLMDDEDCRVVVEFYQGMALFHCKFRHWSVRAMRRIDREKPRIAKLLIELGFNLAHLFIPVGKPILYRFCERFGFRETRRTASWILMEQEVPRA